MLSISYIWCGAIIEQFRQEERPKIVDAIATILVFSTGYLLLMGLISVFTVDETTGLSDYSLIYACGVFIGQAIVIHAIAWIYHLWNQSDSKSSGKYSLLVFFSMTIVVMFLSVFYRYAVDIYPLYPRILGGGRPAIAQLVLKSESVDIGKTIGLNIDSNGHTQPVSILYETSDAYFVIFDDQGIKIKSSEVNFVIYLITGN